MWLMANKKGKKKVLKTDLKKIAGNWKGQI